MFGLTGRETLRHSGFRDPGLEQDLLAYSIFVFAAPNGRGESGWGVHQVSISVEMENGLLLIPDFHSTHVDGFGPTL